MSDMAHDSFYVLFGWATNLTHEYIINENQVFNFVSMMFSICYKTGGCKNMDSDMRHIIHYYQTGKEEASKEKPGVATYCYFES